MPEPSDFPPLTGQLLARCTFTTPTRGPAATPVVCGVSGGADSLALLVLAVASGLQVTAVHVDHQLRPGSAAEADIVAAAAHRFGAEFRSEKVEISAGADLEERARRARLSVLGPHALTGHTADDQAETMLINLLRGTGVSGLGAMKPGPRHPILGLRRQETEALCRDAGLAPVNDLSNNDPRFVRNRVRREVLPLLADISQRDPVPLLTRSATRARSADDALKQLASSLDPTNTRQLQTAHPELAAVALRRWLTDDHGHPPSAAELGRVMEVVHHRARACELRNGRRVLRSDGQLRIECAAEDQARYDRSG